MSFLGGLGAGLSEAAHGWMQMSHDEDSRKKQQKEIQLEGLRTLLSQNDLPEETYVNALDAVAALTKHGPTQQVADTLRQQLQKKVPLGPDEETTQSHANMMKALIGQQHDQEQGLLPSPLPDRETAPSMVRVSDLPRNVYAAQQMLPTRIAERQASMKPSQMVLPDGRTALVGPNGDIISIVNAKIASVANRESANAAAMERLNKRLDANMDAIGERARLKARGDVDRLMAGGYSEDQAIEEVHRKIGQESALRKARIEVAKAQALAIPARVAQGWKSLSDREIQLQISRDLANNTIARTRFDAETKPLFEDLKSTRDSIEYLEKYKAAGPLTEDQQKQLDQLHMDEHYIMNSIWKAKGDTVTGGIAPPPTTKKKDPLGLFTP